MKRIILFAAFVFVCSGVALSAQSVSDVGFRQEGQMIKISYNISGMYYYEYMVQLWVSTDGGVNFKGPLEKVTGDVGGNIDKGQGKSILWDVYNEMPDFGGQVVFDVRAIVMSKKVKRNVYFGYKGSLEAPIGAVIGLTGKTGFYLSARLNKGFFTSAEYETDGELVDYSNTGYYEFTGNDLTQNFSITTGISFQLSKSFHLYTGVGYTSYSLLWEINEYEYPDDFQGMSWARHTEESWQSVELEAGMSLIFNHIFLSASAYARSFKTFGVTLGIGMVF